MILFGTLSVVLVVRIHHNFRKSPLPKFAENMLAARNIVLLSQNDAIKASPLQSI